jgi:hypothetical protein
MKSYVITLIIVAAAVTSFPSQGFGSVLSDVTVIPENPTDLDSVEIAVDFDLTSTCEFFSSSEIDQYENTFTITIYVGIYPDGGCFDEVTPVTVSHEVPPLETGNYQISVIMIECDFIDDTMVNCQDEIYGPYNFSVSGAVASQQKSWGSIRQIYK